MTEARIEHAIQKLRESGVEIVYEPRDLKYIPKEVVEDIEREENDGDSLNKKDRKAVQRATGFAYKRYLSDRVKQIIGT